MPPSVAVDRVGGMGGQEHGRAAEFARVEPAAGRGLRADEAVEGMAAAVGLAFAERGGLRRGDVAGADAVALDVVFTVLGADIAGQHLEAALGRRIGGDGLAAEFGHHRADVDDLPFAALHHFGKDGGGDDVRGHEVHVDDLLEFLALHLVHRDALDDAGVVDEDVDLADLGVNALHQGLDGLFVGDVADIAGHVRDARLLVVGEAALEGGLVDVIENDVLRAGGDESLRDVEADAVGGAGDPGVFPFQGKQIQVIHSVSFCFQIYNRLH